MEYSKSILLIDDDSISNYLVSLLLDTPENAIPYHVARNGEDALQYLTKLSPNSRVLILLDIHMPVLDGFEFLGRLENYKGPGKELLNIVIISSSIAQKDIDNAKSRGIHKFLLKPIKKENLHSIIKDFDLVE